MKTLLYLEDDEALAFVTSRALKRMGFSVSHVASIESAEALLNAPTTLQFTHALLDLKIGNGHSLPLIQKIRHRFDIPIVILTGYGTVRTAVQAMKLGAINFLSKPCDIDDIVFSLQEDDKGKVPQAEIHLSPKDIFEKPSLKALEQEAIQRALDDNGGNISAAARQLKMHRRTLQRKLNKRYIDPVKASITRNTLQ